MSREVMLPLYLTWVQSLWIILHPVLALTIKDGCGDVEIVQRSVAGMINRVENILYSERLYKLHLAYQRAGYLISFHKHLP